jgi:hypothetical protein
MAPTPQVALPCSEASHKKKKKLNMKIKNLGLKKQCLHNVDL